MIFSNTKKNKSLLDQYTGNGKMSIIAPDAIIKGDLKFTGAIKLDGILEGSIETTDGLVWVTTDGNVKGEIKAPHVAIHGTVIGDIYALNSLELGQQAKVHGNLYYGVMCMAEGAQVEGTLHQAKEINSNIIEIDYDKQQDRKTNK